jgi:hypothetical protein
LDCRWLDEQKKHREKVIELANKIQKKHENVHSVSSYEGENIFNIIEMSTKSPQPKELDLQYNKLEQLKENKILLLQK